MTMNKMKNINHLNKADLYFYQELNNIDKNIGDVFLFKLVMKKSVLKKSISCDDFDNFLTQNPISHGIKNLYNNKSFSYSSFESIGAK